MDTSNVYGDNRRTWNSLIYSRFLVIGFHKGVDTYGYQEGKIRGNEGQGGERKKKEKKDLFAQAYI